MRSNRQQNSRWYAKGVGLPERARGLGGISCPGVERIERRRQRSRNVLPRWHGFRCLCWSELPVGGAGRTHKGGVVFRGNDVRDEPRYSATFQDLRSAPAGMSSGKFFDLLGLLPGWILMQADLVQAYAQALLKGVLKYGRIPGSSGQKR